MRAGIVAVITGLMVLAASLLLLVLPPLQHPQSDSELMASAIAESHSVNRDDLDVLSRGALANTKAGSLEGSTRLNIGVNPSEVIIDEARLHQAFNSGSSTAGQFGGGLQGGALAGRTSGELGEEGRGGSAIGSRNRVPMRRSMSRGGRVLSGCSEESMGGGGYGGVPQSARGNVAADKDRRKIQNRRTRWSLGVEFSLPR